MGNKPVTMIIEETKNTIVNAVNNSQLPAFILETIIKDIYIEINQMAIQQANLEKQKYEEELKHDEELKHADSHTVEK